MIKNNRKINLVFSSFKMWFSNKIIVINNLRFNLGKFIKVTIINLIINLNVKYITYITLYDILLVAKLP